MRKHGEFFSPFQPPHHESRDLIRLGFLAFERTLPYDCHAPTFFEQCVDIAPITNSVFFELFLPEIRVVPRSGGRFATVSVPKATMYEHHRPETLKNDVWRSGKFLVMKPIPQSHFVQGFSQFHLWAGIFLTDLAHDYRTGLFIDGIQWKSRRRAKNRFSRERPSQSMLPNVGATLGAILRLSLRHRVPYCAPLRR